VILTEWAKRWNLPPQALEELATIHNLTPNTLLTGMSEEAVQVRIRLEASQKGLRLFRNNVGVLQDARGVPLRYGLANESKQQNTILKSSDLIGIRPIVVTQDMVGKTIGQFVAREVKQGSWVYKGNQHEQAQLNFLGLINALGGDAQFANGEGTL